MTKTNCGCKPKTAHDAQRFFAPSLISKKIATTPEGYLVCMDVAIARTGTMLYGATEIPGMEARDGIIRIERDEAEVFRDETMASFEGKPVTINHPLEDVSPENWHQLTAGITTNVRRGVGMDDNLLLADLLITRKEAIEAVRDGSLREVSCGYDTNFEQTEPGRGRQFNIIGNHVALVDKGRCGSRCAITDKETKPMTKKTWGERIKAAFTLRDEDALNRVLSEAENDNDSTGKPVGAGNVVINVNDAKPATTAKDSEIAQLKADLKKATDALAKLTAKDADEDEDDDKDKAKDEDKDEDDDKKKATDHLFEGNVNDADSLYTEVLSRAEILQPGIQLPKINSKIVKDSAKVSDALCIIKRQALTAALNGNARDAIAPFLNGSTVDKLPCNMVDAAFVGASEIVKQRNISKTAAKDSDRSTVGDAWKKNGIDEINANYWNNKGKK